MCSLESLLGVLYSGFCGAILFGKVLRIQSHAQVIFSDPLVIRYGKGVVEGQHAHGHESSDEESAKLPCPVVEFRIVNRLFSQPGGEIMDASLNVVANIDADDADLSLRHSYEVSSLSGGTNGVVDGNSIGSSSADENASSSSPFMDDTAITGRNLTSIFGPGSRLHRKKNQTLDDDPSNRLVPKMIFSKVSVLDASHVLLRALNELIVRFSYCADDDRSCRTPVFQTSLACSSYFRRIFANCEAESTENDS